MSSISEFYERVDHSSLGQPDLRQKRLNLYLTIDNYLQQNNLNLDVGQDNLGPPIRYYEFVDIKLCNRLIREIYYLTLDGEEEENDRIKYQLNLYVQLLKDVISIIHQHIYKDVVEYQNQTKEVDSILYIHNGEKLENLLYEWFLLQLKIMDYLFSFMICNMDSGNFIRTEDRIEIKESQHVSKTSFISCSDVAGFLKDLDFMEDSFQTINKKTSDSICAIRKNIRILFDHLT